MDTYSTWNSAIHAACIVVQAFKGIEHGMAFSSSLYDCAPDDNECDAPLLATMLRAEGLSCTVYEVLPTDVEAIIRDGLSDSRLTIFQIRLAGDRSKKRWCVTHGTEHGHLLYLSAQHASDPLDGGDEVGEDATGQVVQMQYAAWPPRPVYADVIAGFGDKL